MSDPNWSAIEAVGVCLGAVATFGAVFTALWLQRRQFKEEQTLQRRQFNEERRREAMRRASVNVAVYDAVVAAHKLCEDARSSIEMIVNVKVEEVWETIGAIVVARGVLRHYLSAPIPIPGLVSLATSAEQRLFEALGGMEVLLMAPGPAQVTEAEKFRGQQLLKARNQLQTVVNRVRWAAPELGKVKPAVDADRALILGD